MTIAFAAAGMLSMLGRCHTFDTQADGYCRGEGCCGAVYETGYDVSTEQNDSCALALADSAIQQDGPSASLTAPNGSSQRRLVNAVGIKPCTTASNFESLEAHGTGTALGDPIEVGAAAAALCPDG